MHQKFSTFLCKFKYLFLYIYQYLNQFINHIKNGNFVSHDDENSN